MQCLVQWLHENDEAAFEEVYQLIHQKIYNFILRYVQDRAQAQELTQLLFVKLWDKRQMLSVEKPIESQIFVIARNLVIDHLRKKTRENVFVANYTSGWKKTSTTTEDTVLLHDLEEHFEAAIESLPQKRKEIFKLSRQVGLTYPEIAHRLSISPKTVEIQMSKALKVVRAKLSGFLSVLL